MAKRGQAEVAIQHLHRFGGSWADADEVGRAHAVLCR